MAEDPAVLNPIKHLRTPESRASFALQVTREAQARTRENAEDQARYKAQTNSPFISAGPQVRARANAVRAIDHLRKVRDSLQAKVIVGGDIEAQRAYDHASLQLAENLAILGEFDQAVIVCPTKKVWEQYQVIADAISREDGEWCGHPLYTIARQPGVGQMAVPNFHRVIDVFSKKHGADVPVMQCNECGFMNARHPTVEERELRHTRAKVLKLIEGQDPKEHRSMLENAGLTSAQVFRTNA